MDPLTIVIIILGLFGLLFLLVIFSIAIFKNMSHNKNMGPYSFYDDDFYIEEEDERRKNR